MKQIPTHPPYFISVVDPETEEERSLYMTGHPYLKEAARAAQEADKSFRDAGLMHTVLVRDSQGKRVYACRGHLVDNRMPRGFGIQTIAAGIL